MDKYIDNEIKVSVFCTVFNHEKFLRKCLDGFVNQKTNFKYEVLVHDDVSTDDSINIINEYYKKYPEIIKPIFENENQYSKGVSIRNEILVPRAKGKYIAICEGDDYWCDENKLQEQYDIMEKNLDCSMCVHNTIWHDLLGKNKDIKFNNWKKYFKLTDREVFFPGNIAWNVHTSSFFMRKEMASTPEFSRKKYWFGDFILVTNAYYNGKIIYIPKVMSVYNANNINGASLHGVNKEVTQKRFKLMKDYLKEYDYYTKEKYHQIILERILSIEFDELFFNTLVENYDYHKFKETKRLLKNNNYYKEYIRNLKMSKKLKFYIKLNFFYLYKLLR